MRKLNRPAVIAAMIALAVGAAAIGTYFIADGRAKESRKGAKGTPAIAVTVSLVTQETVPILPEDTAASLHERIQQAERRLYPLCVGALAEQKIAIKGRQTVWLK